MPLEVIQSGDCERVARRCAARGLAVPAIDMPRTLGRRDARPPRAVAAVRAMRRTPTLSPPTDRAGRIRLTVPGRRRGDANHARGAHHGDRRAHRGAHRADLGTLAVWMGACPARVGCRRMGLTCAATVAARAGLGAAGVRLGRLARRHRLRCASAAGTGRARHRRHRAGGGTGAGACRCHSAGARRGRGSSRRRPAALAWPGGSELVRGCVPAGTLQPMAPAAAFAPAARAARSRRP